MSELFVAFSTGLAATVSPCVLPLYPGFLAYLASQGDASSRRANALLLGVLVWAGVITMMLALGAAFAAMRVAVGQALSVITPAAYLVLIVLGLLALSGRNVFARFGQIRAPVLSNPYATAYVYGLLYGPIALPCSGPLLVAIFALGFTATELARQIGLFLVFGAGFGLPLLVLAALGQSRQRQLVRLFVAHHVAVNRLIGLTLIGIGLYGFWESWEGLVIFWGLA